MTTPEPRIGIAAAEIDRAIAHKSLRLRFSPELEDLFEREAGAVRARQLVLRGSVGLLLFVGYLAVDAQLTPDTFWIAAVLRLGVVVPIALILMIMGWYNRAPFWREAASGGVVFLAVLSTLAVMLLSESPLRDAQADSIVLTVLFVTMVQRLRFIWAVITSLAIYWAHLVGVLAMPEYPVQRAVADIIIFGGAVTLALIGSWHAERQVRNFYLFNLRARVANAALEDISQRDALTGLENRRALERALAEMRASAHEGEDVAVALFDVDHFKAYNDGLGHMAGDICLKRIASIAEDELRGATDTPFRFGGEEFLVLFRRTDLATSLAVAERMRRAIEAAAMPHPTRGVVTASFGVAATRIGSAVSSDELIQAADAALYAAKRNGRNQVWPPFLHKGGTVVGIADRKHAG
jgi:diguanylate cyclase (GGDEF)-like protein